MERHNATVLASSQVCTVERCRDCGTIHLHFGGASVRIPAAGYGALCETLLSALSGIPELTHEGWPFARGGGH